jgi:formylglycine-generating enzyme required for sulfatase activity
VGRAVYVWVQGQPYLTQRLGQLLEQAHQRGAAIDTARLHEEIDTVQRHDVLLRNLYSKLDEHQLQEAARQLLTAPPRFSRLYNEMVRLELLGLAKGVQGQWAVRNPLIETALRDWLQMEPMQPLQVPPIPLPAPEPPRHPVGPRLYAPRVLLAVGVVIALLLIIGMVAALGGGAGNGEVARATATATEAGPSATVTRELTDTPQVPTHTSAPASPTTAPSATAEPTTNPTNTVPGVVEIAPGVTMEFVGVPAGPFLMGSSDDDELADDDEKPQHELDLPAYSIGKTEVTNAQFRPFVEGDGYTNADYWTEAGWQWREANDITQPGLWDNSEWNGDAQPVVGISWYEAVAYANWVSAQTGQEFRLPTEAEWEKAARGPDGLIWPWGNQPPNEELANFGQNIEHTVAVGSYPEGATPYGALDMAGNVWEWTATRWLKDYPYEVEEEWTEEYLAGDSQRALRGGSRFAEQKFVRGRTAATTTRATATSATGYVSPVIPCPTHSR